MGKRVLKDVEVTIDGVDLSDHISSVAINTPDDKVDSSAFSGSGFKESMKGLSDASFVFTMQQDFDAGSVNSVLWPLKLSDTPFETIIKPTSAALSPTNPGYKMSEGLLYDYSPISGSVGELSTTEVTVDNAGSAGIEEITA